MSNPTKVYVVQLGGFDTHGNQVMANDPSQGTHATLLENLSTAIGAFQDDLNQMGIEERVVGMTFSEFGRRIRSNGSLGTDHGTAAPLIVFGNCVQAGILGSSPQFPDEVEQRTGVPMQYDFRDVYGSILQDWFGTEAEDIRNLLYPDYTYLPILQNCGLSVSTNEYYLDRSVKLYPQPARHLLNVEFNVVQSNTGFYVITDLHGRIIEKQSLQNLSKGKHQLRLNLQQLHQGNYILQIHLGQASVARKFVKL